MPRLHIRIRIGELLKIGDAEFRVTKVHTNNLQVVVDAPLSVSIERPERDDAGNPIHSEVGSDIQERQEREREKNRSIRIVGPRLVERGLSDENRVQTQSSSHDFG